MLLAQGIGPCLNACTKLFGEDNPCYHCFCTGPGEDDAACASPEASSDKCTDPDSESDEPTDGGLGREEAEAAALCADDPRAFTLALDMGEARHAAATATHDLMSSGKPCQERT